VSVEQAAAAVLRLSTEKMVGAIEEITINQGIDPTEAILIGGGGAAGLNAIAVGRRLQCASVLIPEAGAVLSAAGALMSELSSDYAQLHFTTSRSFAFDKVNVVLASLKERCAEFVKGPGRDAIEHRIELSVEARYPHQIWEIDTPLSMNAIETPDDLRRLTDAFHDMHQRIFEIADRTSDVEFVTWRAKVSCRLKETMAGRLDRSDDMVGTSVTRAVYFPETGWRDVVVHRFETMQDHAVVIGPSIIESSFTTVVVDPGAIALRNAAGALEVTFEKE
jgi:N-methylhydantoinase A